MNSNRGAVVALSGGVGGARFADGLGGVLSGDRLTVVVNTGDDFEHWGLWISPDLDTVMYTLSGEANPALGWGVRDDTGNAMEMMEKLGGETWFTLGDRDLAVHLRRTAALKSGESLSAVTRSMSRALGVECEVLPMTEAPRPTRIELRDGTRMEFQEWFVGARAQPEVSRVVFEGADEVSPEVSSAIEAAEIVLITPSNPYLSIDPILSLNGVRDLLAQKLVVAVSPIVGGKAVKGPLGAMIPALTGKPASARAVAEHYGNLIDGIVLEVGDGGAGFDIPVWETNTVMRSGDDRRRLAEETLIFAESLR